MRKAANSIVLFLFLSWFSLPQMGATQNCNYSQIMAEGKVAFETGDYPAATKKFKAANVCCLREQIADCEAEQWIIKSQETYVNALQAEKYKLELASKAYRYADDNPTHAFRIAEYAIENDPGNDAAREQYLNLLKTHPFPFYASVMEHQDYVSSCAVAPGSNLIATAGWDNQVHLWNYKGELQQTFGDSLSRHQEPVLSVAFSPDGQKLATAGMDNQVFLWDLQGNLVATMTGHRGDVTDVAFSPNGNRIASGSWDGTIKFWNLKGEEINSIAAHDDFITDIDYSASNIIASASWDKTVKIWDQEGNLLNILQKPKGTITSVDFSSDGSALLTAAWDASVLMWDVKNATILQEFSGHTGIVNKALFTPKNDHILTCGADNTVRLWNLNGNQVQSFHYHVGSIQTIAFSPDDAFFVTGGLDRKAAIWFYHGYQDQVFQFEKIRSIGDMAYNTANQSLLFSGGKKAYLTDVNGKIKKTLEGHQYDIVSTHISKNGKYMLTGALDVYLWDANGDTITVYKKHGHLIHDFAIASEKQLVASGSRDDLLCLWNFKGENTFSKKLSPGHDITNVAFSPEEDFMVATSADGKIFLVDLEGNVLKEMTAFDDWITAMSLSPDGEKIAVGDKTGSVQIWSVKGDLILSFQTQHSRISCLAFSPDNKNFLVGDINSRITLRNQEGRAIQQFVGHQAAIERVLFIDQNTILTTSNDGTIRKWRSIKSLMNDKKIYALSLTEQLKYGFEGIDSSMMKKELDELPDPDANHGAKIGRQIFDTEKSYFETGKVLSLQFASFYYSKKAHQSKDIEEKISLQKRAIDYHDAFAPKSMGFQKAILHTKQALWKLGKEDIDEAEKHIEKALAYELPESKRLKSVKSVLGLRQALLKIYLNDWNAAEALILENINVKPFEGSDFFPQLYYLLSDLYLPEGAMTQYQLLEDMDFLESVNAGHPDFAKVRALLKP